MIVRIPPFEVVIGIWLPLAVAVNVKVATAPVWTLATPLVGLTVMELIPPRNTVAVAVPLTACAFAVIVVVPSENPCSRLLVGLENDATDGSELDQSNTFADLTGTAVVISSIPGVKKPRCC